eukprot:2386346-Amphidinium_carterae.1
MIAWPQISAPVTVPLLCMMSSAQACKSHHRASLEGAWAKALRTLWGFWMTTPGARAQREKVAARVRVACWLPLRAFAHVRVFPPCHRNFNNWKVVAFVPFCFRARTDNNEPVKDRVIESVPLMRLA